MAKCSTAAPATPRSGAADPLSRPDSPGLSGRVAATRARPRRQRRRSQAIATTTATSSAADAAQIASSVGTTRRAVHRCVNALRCGKDETGIRR